MAPPVPLPACERGRARNLDDGTCMTSREARVLARAGGVFVDENDTIDCEAKTDELVASARLGKIGCLARAPAEHPCPPRSVREENGCAPLDVHAAIDVARWTHAAAAEVCARLSRSALALASSEAAFEVELTTAVPNNDLTQAFVRTTVAGGLPSPDAARAAAAVDDALRRLGGTASATDVTARAACRMSTRRPISLP